MLNAAIRTDLDITILVHSFAVLKRSSWMFKMLENRLVAELRPGPPLGEHTTVLHQTPSWWGGGSLPLPHSRPASNLLASPNNFTKIRLCYYNNYYYDYKYYYYNYHSHITITTRTTVIAVTMTKITVVSRKPPVLTMPIPYGKSKSKADDLYRSS